ncbi:MAG TPA: L,D-transpeptidase family protein [Chitinophagaceae bacterium]|jgi:murein L,D-transpeptidase YcbB/YkuD|nr:L,D-transpeptidase family protein [Chitinophagaceae bacterium]
MKTVFIYTAILWSLLASCQNAESTAGTAREEKKISSRDRSITPANSFSTLFLDSSALEAHITAKAIPDSVARRIRSFYNARNYQYAWFSGDGLTEQARGFWNLHDWHTTYNKDTILQDKALQKRMDALIAEESLSVSSTDKKMLETELQLTRHFILYTLNNYEEGYVKRKEMERFVPRKKEDALALADSLLNKKHKDNKYFEDVNVRYGQLKEQLGRYVNLAKNGGWPAVPAPKKSWKKGISDPALVAVKRRLHLTGDLPAADTTPVFNDTLELAVKNFQARHGYTPDGIIGPAEVKEMNVPAAKRLQQLLINMERMRWMPNEPSGNLIVVNIPEFVLHVYEGNKKAFDMNVVVGKEGHNTMMFTGDLNQVVFSPHWNVPPSIVKDEILPAIDRNPNYLASQNMEITGNEGGLPVIRQKPGGQNALGKVKFLFPNSFNIYFHDTPSKSLFQKDKRAYSHGCIRLAEPAKMAQYLLRNNPEWTPERIDEAMNSGEEKFVKLDKKVPVFITYYTAWVDENGQLNFRDDIYEHDARQAKKMFRNAL